GVDNRRQDQIVLAYQRYGRGKALAMPIQDSFMWRMDAKVPVADTTHAMFWRRLIRWLVDGVPEQVNVSTTADRVEPGEPIKLSVEVLDSAYVEVNDSRVLAKITSPSGRTAELPVEWTVTRDGEYRASFVPDESGIYDIRVSADRAQKPLGAAAMHVRVSAGDAEYFDAGMRAPLLRRIAEDTGGRFFTPANATALPEAISYSGRGVTVVEERELWDMPALFLALVGFIDAAKKKESVPDANITYLAGKQSARENVARAFTDVAARARPNDAVVVLLLGHGSFDGTRGAFNLPGPDLTVAEWAALLGKLAAQRVAFVNTS